MKIKSDQRNYVIIALCAILIVMGVGYAAFNSLLRINGTASLTSSFCVGFDNTKTNTYMPTAGISGGTLPTGSMSYSGTACSTKYQPDASLTATFKQPGDKIEYTLTIANKSTFAVAIESILVENQSVTSNTTITKENIKYIVEMPLSTTLASNAETTMKVTAMFQNDTDVTRQYSGESQTINVKINAKQDNGSGGITTQPTGFTGTIYRYSDEILVEGLTMNGNATVWYSNSFYPASSAYEQGAVYTTQQECEYWEGAGSCLSGTVHISPVYYSEEVNETWNLYIKNEIVNNIVMSSYVCFVTDTEHCIRGGGTSQSVSVSPYYTSNKAILDSQATWFNNHSGSCSSDSFNANCVIDNEQYDENHYRYEIEAESGGMVFVTLDDVGYGAHCWISGTESATSRCEYN